MIERRCIACGELLISHIDDDPNGEYNSQCARCTAEEDHDFDAEPDVKFDRFGNREPDVSVHHLFTCSEIRAKLVQIFGEPKTDAQHRKLQAEVSKCWKAMPKYEIDHKLHKKIHNGIH